MASIANDPSGRRRILFVAPDESRKTIRLGKIDRKSADAIARHVEALLSAKIGGQPIPRDTAAWLANSGAKLRDKLAAAGLVEARTRAVLGEFLDSFITNRKARDPCHSHLFARPEETTGLISRGGKEQEMVAVLEVMPNDPLQM